MHFSGLGYKKHLYTRTVSEGDSDEIEEWLAREFDGPAEASLANVVNERRLSKDDYATLTRFAASQMVRTPAFMIRNLPRWQKEAEERLDSTFDNLTRMLETGTANHGTALQEDNSENAKYFPMKVSRELSTDPEKSGIRVQTVVGRGTWIYAMRHILTKTINRFTEHRWSIIHARQGLPWFTSDDPLITLNFRNVRDYNFDGGWGRPHTNILLPISPRHLLFSQVGDKRLDRGSELPMEESRFLRKAIAEHAHRYIFSTSVDQDICSLRPRHVDASAYIYEAQMWSNWHSEQSEAERELL